MIDHCISAFRKDQKELNYKLYVTDALKVIADNTMRFNGGSTLSRRYYDILQDMDSTNEPDEKTDEKANSIVNRMKSKLSKG